MGKKSWFPILVALAGLLISVPLYLRAPNIGVYDSYLVTNIALLLWMPMLLILLVGRQEPAKFGFTPGDVRSGVIIGGLLFLGLLPCLIVASRLEMFTEYYPMFSRFFPGVHPGAPDFLTSLLYFELTYGMYLFCWEFFFRGFLLFGLEPRLGAWAILPQAVAFAILHAGKPNLEVPAALIAGIILGVLALRTKSFVPCFVLHWAAAVTFDVLVILAKYHTLVG